MKQDPADMALAEYQRICWKRGRLAVLTSPEIKEAFAAVKAACTAFDAGIQAQKDAAKEARAAAKAEPAPTEAEVNTLQTLDLTLAVTEPKHHAAASGDDAEDRPYVSE
jgi:hypothetical protein